MKWFKRIFTAILLLLVLAAAVIYFYLKSTAPDYSGTKKLSGLKEEVKVYYDDYGVPHIRAQNEEDAYRALGFVQAQDRLFQMEMIRRMVKGRLSEVVGLKALDVDKAMITLQLAASGEAAAHEHFARVDAAWKKAALAYVAGINDFINQGRLPVEFTLMGFKPEPFTIDDVYVILSYMSYSFSSAMREEPVATWIAEKLGNNYLVDFGLDTTSINGLFQPDYDLQFLHSIWMARQQVDNQLPVAPWTGSNSWAVSGSLTKSGKPVLANDTHIGYKQPAVWYEADIAWPGFQFYGYHLPGVPFAVLGHDKNKGWGLTIFPFDNMDLYGEKISPDHPDHYFDGKNWVPFKHKKYNIKVKDSHEIEFDLRFSNHGPVLNDAYPAIKADYNDRAVAAWWAGHHIHTRMLEATYHMARASSMDEFQRWLPLVDIVGLNVTYADNQGNIAWWGAGKIPKRPAGLNSRLIIDGSDTTNNIEGFYDFSANPKSINPASGYIVTANNPPHRVNGVLYPGYYAPGLRAARIESLLKAGKDWDTEKMKVIQNDVHSNRDMDLVAMLSSALSSEEKSSELFQKLEKWDGNYTLESEGATIFNKWLYFALKYTLGDELQDNLPSLMGTYLLRSRIESLFHNEKSPWWDSKNTDKLETRSDIFRQAWQATEEHYRQHPQNLAWGAHHFLLHKHPLGAVKVLAGTFNVGPFPKTGANEVVDKEAYAYSNDDTLYAVSGPAMRMLVDFAQPDDAQGVIPTGQSGSVLSPHYDDQAPLFNSGKYRTQRLTIDRIKKKSVLILQP